MLSRMTLSPHLNVPVWCVIVAEHVHLNASRQQIRGMLSHVHTSTSPLLGPHLSMSMWRIIVAKHRHWPQQLQQPDTC
jgi:hypothetical protein